MVSCIYRHTIQLEIISLYICQTIVTFFQVNIKKENFGSRKSHGDANTTGCTGVHTQIFPAYFQQMSFDLICHLDIHNVHKPINIAHQYLIRHMMYQLQRVGMSMMLIFITNGLYADTVSNGISQPFSQLWMKLQS